MNTFKSINRLRSSMLAMFPAASDISECFGFDTPIWTGGPAALARLIAAYDPPAWRGCYVELGRDQNLKFSCVLFDGDLWDRDTFAAAMRPVISRFTGPRVAYIGISDTDLDMPMKQAVRNWYATMDAIKGAGFTHVGIDAISDSDGMGAYSDAVVTSGMSLLVEGSPSVTWSYINNYHGIIQTTEQYAAPPVGHVKIGGEMPFIVTRHSTSYDPDMQAQWESTEPKMMAMCYEMFVRQIVAEGGIPALPPFGWAERVNTALPEVPQ